MVRRDAVAEDHERACVHDRGGRDRLRRHTVEIGRLLDVFACRIPGVALRCGNVERAPLVVAREDVGVARAKGRFGDGLRDRRVDLRVRRPDLAQIHGLPRGIDSERLRDEVHVHAARERVRDHKRRRREIVCAHLRVDAALEVSVAGKNGGHDHVVFRDVVRDVVGKRAAVADARGAAVTDEIESDLVEVGREARLLEIVRDDFAAGRKARLHPRLARDAAFHGLLRDEPGADHHGRVRRVRARGDRGDHHGAIGQFGLRARGHGRAAAFVREARRRDFGALSARAIARDLPAFERLREARLHVGERHAILRPARPREIRHDGAEVEFERIAEDRIERFVGSEEPLRARVRFDEIDLLGGAARELQVRERVRVDRKDRDRRAVLRRHVPDRYAIGHAEIREPRAVELDELADHALLTQDFGYGENEIGRGHALVQLAGQLEADHVRHEHRNRLPEHCGFRFDAAHAPRENPETVGHRRVRIRADDGIRIGDAVRIGRRDARAARTEDHAAEKLDVDLVHDARIGRNGAEVGERVLTPLQERVTFAVALELEMRVLRKRACGAEPVDLHRVIDHELDRLQRVDLLRVAAHLGHRIAHRREVDHTRDAREILQQDARRPVRDLGVALRLRIPVGQRLDVARGDAAAVLEADEVLEQNLQAKRQARDARMAGPFHGVDSEDRIRPVADGERVLRLEAVRMRVLHNGPKFATAAGRPRSRRARRAANRASRRRS